MATPVLDSAASAEPMDAIRGGITPFAAQAAQLLGHSPEEASAIINDYCRRFNLRPVRLLRNVFGIELYDLKALISGSVPGVEMVDVSSVDRDAYELVPAGLRDSYNVVGLRFETANGSGETTLVLGSTSDLPDAARSHISRQLGREPRWVRITPAAHRSLIVNLAGGGEIGASRAEADAHAAALDNWRTLTMPASTGGGDPVSQLIEGLFLRAEAQTASDIHIFPELVNRTPQQPNGVLGYELKIRLQGILERHAEVSESDGLAVLNRLRAAAGVAMDENRALDAGLSIVIGARGSLYDLRMVFVPLINGPSVVIRLLKHDVGLKTLEDLFPPDASDHAAAIRRLTVDRPDGIFLVAGATGDGKSTTLSAVISEIASSGEMAVMTVEDPVEINVPRVRQSNASSQFGFADGLKAFMRADPDVIMVGEIRDADTALAAIRAAQTGHLVLSTIHATASLSAPARFLGMLGGAADKGKGSGGEGSTRAASAALADTLNGVLSQKLLRCLCAACSQPKGKPVGCPSCGHKGWSGRVAVAEVLESTPEVQAAIGSGGAPAAIADAAPQVGSLWHAERLVKASVTTQEEVARVFGAARLAEERERSRRAAKAPAPHTAGDDSPGLTASAAPVAAQPVGASDG